MWCIDGWTIVATPCVNDSHMLVSQLHLAMLKAHNAFVDEARLTGIVNDRVFDEAEAGGPFPWS